LAICHISSSTINSGDAAGRYTGIKLSLLSAKYCSTFFDLYSVVLPYPEIDSILEIFCVFVLGSLKMYFGQTSHTV